MTNFKALQIGVKRIKNLVFHCMRTRNRALSRSKSRPKRLLKSKNKDTRNHIGFFL